MIEIHNLTLIPEVRHGFFTRANGYSSGLYHALNCGYGSNDNPKLVAQNRTHVATALGLPARQLITAHQIHSANVVTVTKPWAHTQAPRADGMVTNQRGLALGVLSADCAPLLFADNKTQVIGAAHAGWRGALAGITDAVIEAMEALGAQRGAISAAIGPTITQPSYEVGPEMRKAFLEGDAANARFFEVSSRHGHFQFDLPAYLENRLRKAGLKSIETIAACTYICARDFFSYRRTTHAHEPDYGRQISAITLGPDAFHLD